MLGKLFSGRGPEERSAPFVVSSPSGWGWVYPSQSLEVLRNAAVWACKDVLASSVSSLPLGSVREEGRARIPVSPTPSLLAKPSGTVTLDVWLYQLMWSLTGDGNAFGLITSTDNRGWPTSIETLNPEQVTERDVVKGVVQAKVDGKVMKAYPYGDLWHVPGKVVPAGSPFGLSPDEYAANAINAGLSAESFGMKFFTDGGHPTKVIYSEQELNPTQAQAIKDSFKRATVGNEPAVFGAGLKMEDASAEPSKTQFIDLQRFTVEQVCRFYRVPPSMVYAAISGQNVTYANVSQADLHYLKHSLDGPLVRIEYALSALLPRPQIARFNRAALLRADAATRYEVHERALRTKTRTVNEVRALEDEPPFDGAEFNEPGIPGGAAAPEPTQEGDT